MPKLRLSVICVVLLLLFSAFNCIESRKDTRTNCATLDYVSEESGYYYGVLTLIGNTQELGITIDVTLDLTANLFKTDFGNVTKVRDGGYRIYDNQYSQPSNETITISMLVRQKPNVDLPIQALQLNGKYICFSSKEVPAPDVTASIYKRAILYRILKKKRYGKMVNKDDVMTNSI